MAPEDDVHLANFPVKILLCCLWEYMTQKLPTASTWQATTKCSPLNKLLFEDKVSLNC